MHFSEISVEISHIRLLSVRVTQSNDVISPTIIRFLDKIPCYVHKQIDLDLLVKRKKGHSYNSTSSENAERVLETAFSIRLSNLPPLTG